MLIYSAMTHDGKMYVGKTVLPFRKRISCHHSSAKRSGTTKGLHGYINKYGKDSIEWGVIVEGIQNPTALANYEEYYIKTKDTYRNGLNLTPRAFGPVEQSEESKRKTSIGNTGSKNPNWKGLPIESICSEYMNGDNSGSLAKKYGVSRPTILYHLKKNGIQVRSNAEAQKLSKFKRGGRMEVGKFIWITNGIDNKLISDKEIPVGYIKGRTMRWEKNGKKN